MTTDQEEHEVWNLLLNRFQGYAEDSELLMAFAGQYFPANLGKGFSAAQAAIQRLTDKEWIRLSEANAGKHFYRPTDKGKEHLAILGF